MYIERVQIEEGFLDGLDVSFTRGLNVIIGERGTGKTSLIELVRFCLDVQGYTRESTKRSRNARAPFCQLGTRTGWTVADPGLGVLRTGSWYS